MSKRPSPSGLQKNGVPVTDWPTIRTYVLERDEHLCQTCKVNVASEVDHIWPRRLGGADHIDNLRAICGPCNKAKGARVDLTAASSDQLKLARNAIGARLAALQLEHNEVVGEELRRYYSDDARSLARVLLLILRNERRARAEPMKQWERLFDIAFPPENVAEMVRSVESAVLRLAGRDEKAVVRECTQADLLSILRAYGVFRELADAALPGVSPSRPTTLSRSHTRAYVMEWLHRREELRRHAEEAFNADRAHAAALLEYMPDEETTVEQAIAARKKAQP